MLFEPLDFIARLAALVPKPRVHLTRFHGVFAPNSKHRAVVTGEAQGKQIKSKTVSDHTREIYEPRKAMSWAMRLKRVFNIDITVCKRCQGEVKIIACIEERHLIDKILSHINQRQETLIPTMATSGIRAPPTDIVARINPG